MLGATGCDGGGYDNLLVRVDVETRRVPFRGDCWQADW
jgi:hypothetical protein